LRSSATKAALLFDLLGSDVVIASVRGASTIEQASKSNLTGEKA
jgi:hypothetical protein